MFYFYLCSWTKYILFCLLLLIYSNSDIALQLWNDQWYDPFLCLSFTCENSVNCVFRYHFPQEENCHVTFIIMNLSRYCFRASPGMLPHSRPKAMLLQYQGPWHRSPPPPLSRCDIREGKTGWEIWRSLWLHGASRHRLCHTLSALFCLFTATCYCVAPYSTSTKSIDSIDFKTLACTCTQTHKQTIKPTRWLL